MTTYWMSNFSFLNNFTISTDAKPLVIRGLASNGKGFSPSSSRYAIIVEIGGMEMEIRSAVLADLPMILRIYNHMIATSAATFDLEEQTLEQRLEWFHHYGGKYPLIVAVEEGQVVGYCSLSMFRTKPAYDRTAEVSVYIDPVCQGRGIGKHLLAEILRLGKELNYHAIIAGITTGNEVSIRLHEQFGFTFVGRFREVGWKFDQWQDVDFYQLTFAEES